MSSLPNSYLDAAEATQILSETIGNESWIALNDSVKLASLIQASQLLDSNFDWVGEIATDIQTLRWPRKNVLDRDGREIPSDIIPNDVKIATAQLAAYLVKSKGLNSVPNNVESLKVGPISLSFDSTESVNEQLVPRYIIALLSSLGSYSGPSDSSSAYNVKAIRT